MKICKMSKNASEIEFENIEHLVWGLLFGNFRKLINVKIKSLLKFNKFIECAE